ncbi:unnamed protein product [Rhizophagus irregularis]|nr:unnamed protein product [Rhizophagus irregularis]
MKPTENCILKLEARIASCYIQMLKLATAINRLPSSKTLNFLLQNLQSPQKFDHEACLFPLYHGRELNDKAFQISCRVATKYWQTHDPPFNLDYDSKSEPLLAWWLTYEMPLVSLAVKDVFKLHLAKQYVKEISQFLNGFMVIAGLVWILVELKLMSMIHSFWITNAKKEITADGLRNCTQISTVMDEFDELNEYDDAVVVHLDLTSLNISLIVNLDHV